MIAGPLFRVELVTAARRRRHFAVRVAYAALLLLVLWSTYEATGLHRAATGSGRDRVTIQQAAATATAFFWSFSWVQLWGIIAVTPALAAGAIATERERRTIEYLFVTDLSNLEIVWGKILAKLLLAGKLLLVGAPILMLLRLLGGIPASMLVVSFTIAGSTALVLTALGVCISVWSKRSRDAATRTYLAMIAIAILPGIVSAMFGWGFRPQAWWNRAVEPAVRFLWELNPVVVLGQEMASRFGGGGMATTATAFRMAAWHVAIAAALLAIATTSVRRVHLREVSRGDAPPQRWRRGLAARWPRWRPAIGDHPMLWKEAFAPTAKSKLGIVGGLSVGLIAATALGTAGYWFWDAFANPQGMRHNLYFEMVVAYEAIVGTVALIMVAARASTLFTLEKERDCWVSLLSTPLTGGEIIRGKLLGNLYAARWLLGLLAFAWLLGFVIDVRFVPVAAILAATFLLCAAFVSTVGLWFSLRSSTSLRAQGFTLATCMFLGGLYLMCCCPVLAAGGRGDDDSFAVGLAPCMPFLLALPAASFEGEMGREEGSLVTAYVLGVIGYSIATGVLLTTLAARFDSIAGRTTGAELGAGSGVHGAG